MTESIIGTLMTHISADKSSSSETSMAKRFALVVISSASKQVCFQR